MCSCEPNVPLPQVVEQRTQIIRKLHCARNTHGAAHDYAWCGACKTAGAATGSTGKRVNLNGTGGMVSHLLGKDHEKKMSPG